MQIFEKFSKIIKSRGINLDVEQEKKVFDNFLSGLMLELLEGVTDRLNEEEIGKVKKYLSNNQVVELLDLLATKFATQDDWGKFVEERGIVLLDDFLNKIV